PAPPEATVLRFVPLLVLLAGVLGIELLQRLRNSLVALAPGFAVVVLSQCYAALSGFGAVLAVLAYAATAGTLLAVTRADRVTDPAGSRRRWVTSVLPKAGPMVVLAVVCALVAGLLAPAVPPVYSLKNGQATPLAETKVISPLDQIADRLRHPGTAVFEVRGGGEDVDRWPLAVLDTFDGVNWTSAGQARRLGAELLPGPAVTVGVQARSAEITPLKLDGPWLPSQTWPAGVTGTDPLIEEQQGTLLANGPGSTTRYTLHWWEPEPGAKSLQGYPIDENALERLGGVGEVPDGMNDLAKRAVQGKRPSFDTALALETFLRVNYKLATVDPLPTGHAWPKLADFLQRDKRGTSEQFAAAYVALARLLGIPARLVVGFRSPAGRVPGQPYTVVNKDVMAWPEVAVADVGWVKLNPSGEATAAGPGAGLAAAADRARAELPKTQNLPDPPVAPAAQASGGDGGGGFGAIPLGPLAGVAGLLLLAWLGGVPALTSWRAWRRRRRTGAGAVIGAWEEARDRLRAHGIGVSAGMTVRDLATASAGVGGPGTADGLRALASTVDLALWSGAAMGEQPGRDAWAAVRVVRRGLAARGWRTRLRAAVTLRNLAPRRR
ncbi:DUF3488 and transglutaminase-like domain-containing protein, partial [Amycolatopsis sp. H20-H5]|uniref:DUF3488 and transglutaminase-like domain-containing protein n=1 Tax=Amycolatopsis sp. H20-H5 TaxID=3046309 RepID=UPI002DB8F3CD